MAITQTCGVTIINLIGHQIDPNRKLSKKSIWMKLAALEFTHDRKSMSVLRSDPECKRNNLDV